MGSSIKFSRKQTLWLVAAAVLLFFSNGRYPIVIASWLAPVFMIRFLRFQTIAIGLITGLLVNIVITIFSWKGMIPVPGKLFIAVGGMIGLISFFPYVFDRLLHHRISGVVSTLVFPCAWVGFEYINSLFNPYATWGSLAYTQSDGPLAFLQLVSITGIWGPVFLITWFASLFNLVWEQHFDWPAIKPGIGLYLGITGLILFVGGLRLSLFPPTAETVRIASIISPFEWVLQDNYSDQAELAALRESTLSVQGELLQLSKQAAMADADIIFWNEAAAPVFEVDEKAFIKKASLLASDLGVYLMLSLYTRPKAFPHQALQNKVLMLDPDGKTLFQYLKSKPVPGENIKRGNSKLVYVTTPFGRIGAVICFDMDFPGLIRQAGQHKIDLMLVPADDWEEINPLHTYMASFRALENGFSLVRATKEGLSGAFDYQGRLLSSLDEFTTSKKIMFSDLPIKGTPTIYAVIGDLFAWLSLAGLTGMILFAVIRQRQSRRKVR